MLNRGSPQEGRASPPPWLSTNPRWLCKPTGTRAKPLANPSRKRWGCCPRVLRKGVGPREARPPPRGPRVSAFSWVWDPARYRPAPGRRPRRRAGLGSRPGPRQSGLHGNRPANNPRVQSPRETLQGAPHATSISGSSARAGPRQDPGRAPTERQAAPTTRPQKAGRQSGEWPSARASPQAPQGPRAARPTPCRRAATPGGECPFSWSRTVRAIALAFRVKPGGPLWIAAVGARATGMVGGGPQPRR